MSYMGTGLDFFSIGVDFFESDCMVIMGTKYGSRALLLAIRLQSKVYDEGYFYHWGEDELMLFTHKLGSDYTAEYVREVVLALVERGFFDRGKFDTYGILTSVSIQSLYFEAVKRRGCVEVEGDYLLVDIAKFKNVHRRGEEDVDNPAAIVDNEAENADIPKQKKREEKRIEEKTSSSLNSSPEGTAGGGGMSEEELLNSIPRDGVKRNCIGLIDNLRTYGATGDDLCRLVKYCNYGVIGHPVWQAIAEIRGSGGKIKKPVSFLWSCLRKGAAG